jgi:hypothetical protein
VGYRVGGGEAVRPAAFPANVVAEATFDGETPDATVTFLYSQDSNGNGVPDAGEAVIELVRVGGAWAGTERVLLAPANDAQASGKQAQRYKVEKEKYASYEVTGKSALGADLRGKNFVFNEWATMSAANASGGAYAYDQRAGEVAVTFGRTGTARVFYSLDADCNGVPDEYQFPVYWNLVDAATNEAIGGSNGAGDDMAVAGGGAAQASALGTRAGDEASETAADVQAGTDGVVRYSKDAPEVPYYVAVGYRVGDGQAVTFTAGFPRKVTAAAEFPATSKEAQVTFLYKQDVDGNGIPDDAQANVRFFKGGAEQALDAVAVSAQVEGEQSLAYAIDRSKYRSDEATGTTAAGQPVYGNNYIFDGKATAAAAEASEGRYAYDAAAGALVATLGKDGKAGYDMAVHYAADFNADGVADEAQIVVTETYACIDAGAAAAQVMAPTAQAFPKDGALAYRKDAPQAPGYVAVGYRVGGGDAVLATGGFPRAVTAEAAFEADGAVEFLYRADQDSDGVPDALEVRMADTKDGAEAGATVLAPEDGETTRDVRVDTKKNEDRQPTGEANGTPVYGNNYIYSEQKTVEAAAANGSYTV